MGIMSRTKTKVGSCGDQNDLFSQLFIFFYNEKDLKKQRWKAKSLQLSPILLKMITFSLCTLKLQYTCIT